MSSIERSPIPFRAREFVERVRDKFHNLPFIDTTHEVEISPVEKTIGIETKRHFDAEIRRRAPWHINLKERRIEVVSRQIHPKENLDAGQPNQREDGEWWAEARIIPFERLEQEKLSSDVAVSLFHDKQVEDKLPDYMGRAIGMFRKIWGVRDSYDQWGKEEQQHSAALGLILIATGDKTQQELEEDYSEKLTQTWELPFTTPRQMVMYGAFQERLTNNNYSALATAAGAGGAPHVRDVIRLIARDEGFHEAGYRAFAKIFARHDREGAIEDAVHVGLNFKMPALNLVDNAQKVLRSMIKVKAFGRKLLTEETIFKELKALEFVPEDVAAATADAYWGHQKELAAT